MRENLTEVKSFSTAVFNGFILKRGYFYGTDANGIPIATSTCVKDGKVAIYEKAGNAWVRKWVPVEQAKSLYPNLNLSARK